MRTGYFSWIEVECLAACVNAPMVQINDDYYEDLTPATLSDVLGQLAAGKTPRTGPQVERQFSAPIGGPTSLADAGLPPAHHDDGSASSSGALQDAKSKRPGEPANIHASPLPIPPVADSSRPRQ